MPIKRGSIDLVVCTLYRIILIYWQWQCHNYIISSKNELNWKELNPSLITNSIPHKIYSQVSLIFPKSWLDFPQQWRHKTSVEGEPFRWHEIYMRSLEGMELRSFGGTLGLQGALATEIVKRYMWYNIISSLYIYIYTRSVLCSILVSLAVTTKQNRSRRKILLLLQVIIPFSLKRA